MKYIDLAQIPEEVMNLPDSAFDLVNRDDIKDEEFKTKPIGFLRMPSSAWGATGFPLSPSLSLHSLCSWPSSGLC